MMRACNKAAAAGKAMVELILILPMMILVPTAVVEMSNFMQYTQVASFTSGQAALIANRGCADFISFTVDSGAYNHDLELSKKRTQECLASGPLSEIESAARNYLPNDRLSLVVSVYRYDLQELNQEGAKLTLMGRYPELPPESGDDEVETLFALVGNEIRHSSAVAYPTAHDQVLVSEAGAVGRRRLVVAELNYHYNRERWVLGWLYSAFNRRTLYREVTVL